MRLALLAHDKKRPEMAAFASAHRGFPAACGATAPVAGLLLEKTLSSMTDSEQKRGA
jgi:methylglyoxal synthase